MKLLTRKPVRAESPEVVVESCPTILMHDDQIVEVCFTDWSSRDGVAWDLVSRSEVFVAGMTTRVIFELPIGCFEAEMSRPAWNGYVRFIPDSGVGQMQPCHRTRGDL